MQKDFETQHHFTPEKEKPVFHGVLSFPHGEDPGDEKMVEIARRYLEEIGMSNTQYAFVKHTDKEHIHLHVLANRVDNDGVIIGKGLIIERGIKAARKLTEEYGLRPETGKNLDETRLEALHEPDAKRYRLYQMIREQLPGCQSLEDLEKRLLEHGVTTRYRLDDASGERVGISWRSEDLSFKGSRVDESCSLKNLVITIAQQVELQLQQRLAIERQQALEKEIRLNQENELKKGMEEEARVQRQKELHEELEERLSIRYSRGRGLRM
jgi:hypothetical protein